MRIQSILSLHENLQHELKAEYTEDYMHYRLEVANLMNRLYSQRYRLVLQQLFVEEVESKKLADLMRITADNLYNIKLRALKKIEQIAGIEQNVS